VACFWVSCIHLYILVVAQEARVEMKKVVSLFSGCGGFDSGFKEQGFDLIYACDIDPVAVDCYARNIDSRVYVRDVTSVEFHRDMDEIGSCDIVLGGFPCQGFSKAGPKNAEDKRNVLYVEMKNALAVLRPQIFIAENVDGISQNFKGAYLERIVEDFQQIGYRVEYRIFDAIAFGLPQHRRRIFFVGIEQSIPRRFSWPEPTHFFKRRNGEFTIATIQAVEPSAHWPQTMLQTGDIQTRPLPQRIRTIKDAIQDIRSLDSNIPDHCITHTWPSKYTAIFQTIREGQKLCNVRRASTSVYTWQIPEAFGAVSEQERCILETIAKYRRHKKYGNLPNGNPLPVDEIERLSGLHEIQRELENLLAKDYIKCKNGGYDLKGALFCSGLFKRPLWNEPAPTVLTNFHNPRYFLHPLEDRPFTLRECARLQGFPDSFIFTTSNTSRDLISGYRLVGNAVPPIVSKAFAAAVRQFLFFYFHCL
jgi:DNA (cytosine-5)-methyltransferase 1